ncbi:AAA family ATPase [Belnapia sp. T18]|uniref:AAA family ATPase n=1 Tax=Belnapia arida TaxID=2804533 RepID=A0ABS1U206_9PROT|nr:AAA family ATPase [Belnapia arida]
MFFDEIGLDNRLARKAVEFWGDEAVAKLRENPYRLLTICPWSQVDRCARLLGVMADDERRLIGAVETSLYERLDQKHTVTLEKPVLLRVGNLLGTTREVAGHALTLAVRDGAAVPGGEGFQPAGAAYAERFIERRIAGLLATSERQQDLFVGKAASTEVDEAVQEYDASAAHRLTDEQQAAVRMVMSSRVSILTGGAGVGKTTCLRAINIIARRFGLNVIQLALAGRAAKRMADATGQSAQTIASWLREAATGRQPTGPRSLIILDEASMLDLPTMYRLLWRLHEEARLLLVGDVGQLPPIGYGLVLHCLVESDTIPRIELTRILRASETTGIPMVSRAIRDGVLPPLLPYEPGQEGCSFVPCRPDRVVEAIERIRGDLDGQDVQIISAAYGGPAGIDAVNTHFHRFNAHGKPRFRRFTVGDPVIWLKNDYARGLWNGSMGMVIGIDGGHLQVRLDGQEFDLDADDLDDLDLAYAISCHKAQGSQWGTVIVPLVQSYLMDRVLLYTALTRAQRRLILVGDFGLLERVVSRPPASIARSVGLAV